MIEWEEVVASSPFWEDMECPSWLGRRNNRQRGYYGLEGWAGMGLGVLEDDVARARAAELDVQKVVKKTVYVLCFVCICISSNTNICEFLLTQTACHIMCARFMLYVLYLFGIAPLIASVDMVFYHKSTIL